MTDSEIVKALFECSNNGYNEQNGSCRNCPYDEKSECPEECMSMLAKDALDLIKRQQAQLERLRANNKATMQTIADVRALAIEDFSELLVSKAKSTKERFLLEPLVESVMREMVVDDDPL